MIAGYALADEGVVERTNVCRKGTLIIKTSDDVYVAATRSEACLAYIMICRQTLPYVKIAGGGLGSHPVACYRVLKVGGIPI